MAMQTEDGHLLRLNIIMIYSQIKRGADSKTTANKYKTNPSTLNSTCSLILYLAVLFLFKFSIREVCFGCRTFMTKKSTLCCWLDHNHIAEYSFEIAVFGQNKTAITYCLPTLLTLPCTDTYTHTDPLADIGVLSCCSLRALISSSARFISSSIICISSNSCRRRSCETK